VAVAPHLARALPPSRIIPVRRSHLAVPKTDTPRRGTVAGEEKAVAAPETKAVERAPENKGGFGPLTAAPKK
jgi:hypothetical protein